MILSKFLQRTLLFGTLIALASCSPQATAPPSSPTPTATAATDSKALVLADVSTDPRKKIKRFQPLADYLAADLEEFEIASGTVKIAPDLETMLQWLKQGEVDLYFDSPYPAMLAVNEAGAKPILRRWKGGDAEYHTVIFTMPDRNITKLSDLSGKMVAFDDNRSTTGYMLPVAYLLEAGLNPVEKSSANATIPAGDVGYIFSDDDENTIEWVISGKTTAGAVDIQTFMEVPEEIRASMTVLVETEKVTRNVVLVRADMPPEQLQALKARLLAMDKNPTGQDVLKQFKTKKFDTFPTEDSLQRMQAIYETIQAR